MKGLVSKELRAKTAISGPIIEANGLRHEFETAPFSGQMDFDTVPYHISMSVMPTAAFPMGICHIKRGTVFTC